MKIALNRGKLERKFNFTLIELALALTIVSVGFVGVTSITSVGISIGRDAISKGITIDAAEQFLRLNTSRVKDNWEWLDIFPDSRPDYDDSGLSDDTDLGWSNSAFWGNETLQIRFVTRNRDAPFDHKNPENQTGFFLVEQQVRQDKGFDVSIRAWKNINDLDNLAQEATLFVEASYPPQKPYVDREKQMFRLEILKAPKIEVASIWPPESIESYKPKLITDQNNP